MRVETIITKRFMELRDKTESMPVKLCRYCKNVSCIQEFADSHCHFIMQDMDKHEMIHSLVCILKNNDNDEYFDTALKIFNRYHGSAVSPYELYSILREFDICQVCSGTGVDLSGDEICKCNNCKGTGEISRDHKDDDKIGSVDIGILIKIPNRADKYYDLERIPYKYEKKDFFSDKPNKDIFVLYNNKTCEIEYIGIYNSICRYLMYPFWCDIEDWSEGKYSLYKKEVFFDKYVVEYKGELLAMFNYNLSQHLHIYSHDTLAGDMSDSDTIDKFVDSFETNEALRKCVMDSIDTTPIKTHYFIEIITKVHMDFSVVGFNIGINACKWVIETLHFMLNGGKEGNITETYKVLETTNTCAMYIFEYVMGIYDNEK